MSEAYLKCISCNAEFSISEKIYTCRKCNDLLDVVYDFPQFDIKKLKKTFGRRKASNQKNLGHLTITRQDLNIRNQGFL